MRAVTDQLVPSLPSHPAEVIDDLQIEQAAERLLRQAPYHGRAAIRSIAGIPPAGPASFCVCVPLRNEEALLPGMLGALDRACNRVSESGVAVFVANDTTDGSIGLLRSWARTSALAVVIVDLTLDPAIRGAPFARHLALELGALMVPNGRLFTTDADTQVDRDWLAANLRLLDQGADMVCGKVDLNKSDLAVLPTRVHECGRLEDDYAEATGQLWRLWTGSDCQAPALQALGASLAIRTECYRAVGGLPTPHSGEDKALARLALAHGFAVVSSDEARVVTSGRTEGRTQGGVSAALRERATTDNPPLDEDLVPVAVLRRRAALWNQLAEGVERTMIFQRACQTDPGLHTPRMCRRDVEREIAVARHHLALLVKQAPGTRLMADV